MKRRLQLFAAILSGFAAIAQVTEGSVSMGAGYANQVFYKLSNQQANAYPHSSWDLAFLRTSAFGFATRINDAKGISVFEASNNISDWATIDVSQEAAWTPLYNSETEWEKGALDFGSATYGWGEYNVANHHVSGSIVFVLKYADMTYKKFKIDDFFGGYTFTYSSWTGSAWSADQTVVLSNTTNPTTLFNYYSLQANAPVVAEPAAADWDLVFTKYNTDIMGDGSMMYPVTGVLHHPNATVAENVEVDGEGGTSNLEFSENINTIGYDWKTFSGTSYTIDTNKAFYVKTAANTIYRLVFSSFTGSSNGNITFNQEDVTNQLGIENVGDNVSFGLYPNPSSNKKINVVYDVVSTNSDQNTITVYSLSGAKVFESKMNNAAGFFNTEIDLGALNTGIYLLKFQSGNYAETKKLVLN